MPLDLNNLLNSTPVSPPHSNPRQQQQSNNNTPSSSEISNALLKNQHSFPQQPGLGLPLSDPLKFDLRPPLFKDNHNHNKRRSPPTVQKYQKPVPITSFSYDNERRILCNNHQFNSLRPLIYPTDIVGFDLNHGIESAVYQDESINEGLDGLLISLMDFIDKTSSDRRLDQARGLMSTKVITWRGMLTKLCSSIYENQNQNSGWSMNVMMIDGTLYIEEGMNKQEEEKTRDRDRQSYYGYSYESLMTNNSNSTSFQNVNTNQQWVSVVKSNLNGIRLILGGEVDAIDNNHFNHHLSKNHPDHLHQHQQHVNIDNIDPDHYVEIKTCIYPTTDRDFSNLYRFKLLKFWLQSYLLGTPKIHVGLRDREGIVRGTTEYETRGIPRLVEEKGHYQRWSSQACLEGGTEILRRVLNELEGQNKQGNTRQGHFQAELDSIVRDEYEYQKKKKDATGTNLSSPLSEQSQLRALKLKHWPIFQLQLIPHRPANSVELKPLDTSEAELDLDLNNKRSNTFFDYFHLNHSPHFFSSHVSTNSRIGFLPHFWIFFIIQLRVDLLLEKDLSSPNT